MNRGPKLTRRQFLVSSTGAAVVATAATRPLPAGAVTAGDAVGTAAAAPAGYVSLGADEAVFVEAMVDIMCPADELTPSGTQCGVATFIDRQLGGAYGHGDRLYVSGPWMSAPAECGYQLPLSREEWFKAGVAAAQAKCRKVHAKPFDELSPAEASDFLTQLASGAHDSAGFALGTWFNELAYPLFTQGCFADPIYGGNRDKVFWKLVGYPGLPATHSVSVVALKGKRVPAAADPRSIQDFS